MMKAIRFILLLFITNSLIAQQSGPTKIEVYSTSIVKKNAEQPLKIGMVEVKDGDFKKLECLIEFPGNKMFNYTWENLDKKNFKVHFDFPKLSQRQNVKVSIRNEGKLIFNEIVRKNAFHFGVESNHPLRPLVRANKQKGKLPAEHSFVSTSDPFAVITTIKKAEDDSDMVLRLLEAEGKDKTVQIDLSHEVEAISRTDMIEENPKKLDQEGKALQLELGKHAVETYKMSSKK